MKLLCLIKHAWQKRPDEDGCYGMGLTSFEMQQCGRCGIWRDRVKGMMPDGRTHHKWYWTERSKDLWK